LSSSSISSPTSIPPSDPSLPDWLAAIPATSITADLGPLQLAWLGDAVWELHHRLRHCRQPGRSGALHRAVVAEVRADAQAAALAVLERDGLLTPEELELVRKGRNRAGRGPRKGEAGIYGRATGFETMVGWLFLQDPSRLAQLLAHLENAYPITPLPADA
jgi:ribonuclease-3 family protein